MNRIIERETKKIVNREMSSIATGTKRTSQAIFDRLVREHGGEPVEACIPRVRAAFAEAGLTPDDEAEIVSYAETVSAGDRIVVEVTTSINW